MKKMKKNKGFEKHRTTNRFCNLLVYCCEGVKKLCVKTSRVNSVLETLEIVSPDPEDIQNHVFFSKIIVY